MSWTQLVGTTFQPHASSSQIQVCIRVTQKTAVWGRKVASFFSPCPYDERAGCNSVVESLPSVYAGLGSVPNTTEQNKTKTRVSESLGQRWDLRNCASQKLPRAANTVANVLTLGTTALSYENYTIAP